MARRFRTGYAQEGSVSVERIFGSMTTAIRYVTSYGDDMVRNSGIVLDHTVIYERIWNYDFGPDSKNLAVYISYLRRKIEADGEPKLIHTVRGVGYTARSS